MENKLQAKGLGLNGEVLFDEELGTIGEETPIKDKNGVQLKIGDLVLIKTGSYFLCLPIEKCDGECIWLIKKGAIRNITLQINKLIVRVKEHISYTTPEVYCAIEDIKTLKKLIKENPNCDYNKDMYNKVLEWYDYMSKIIVEIDKKYEEIFLKGIR